MSDQDFNDSDGFRAAMGDVRPLKVQRRVQLQSSKTSELTTRARRQAATEVSEAEFNELSGEYAEAVEPQATLSFQRPGVQHGVFRNLRLGKYTLEASLDLHGYTVEQARQAVYTFVSDCVAHDIRCALITHGKGEGREQPALLKSCIAHWLPQMDSVLALHSAQKRHGAAGATYLLLRKNGKSSPKTDSSSL